MVKYLLNISYDGKNFFGWSRQHGKRTVQQSLETAISNFINVPVHVQGSSRTDSKVHSLDSFSIFETANEINTTDLIEKLKQEIKDIKVKKLKLVSNNFQPRFDSKGKVYQYRLKYNSKNIFENSDYQWNIKYNLEKNQIKFLKKLSKKFIGEKDFASFTAKEKYPSTIRQISKIKIKKRNEQLTFYIYGNGFMRYQVRNIIGSLVNAVIGKISIDEFDDLFNKPKIGKNHYKAPAQGLYLYKTIY